MAIRYEISTWDSSTAMKARKYVVRARRDAALSELWAQIHTMLAADGGLDTQRALRLSREFDDFAPKLETGLRRGYYRQLTFCLRSEGERAAHVEFRQMRH